MALCTEQRETMYESLVVCMQPAREACHTPSCQLVFEGVEICCCSVARAYVWAAVARSCLFALDSHYFAPSGARPNVMDAWAAADAWVENPESPSDAPARQPSGAERGLAEEAAAAWGAAARSSREAPERGEQLAEAANFTSCPDDDSSNHCSSNGAPQGSCIPFIHSMER